MASGMYNRAKAEFARGNIDWVAANIDVMLVQTGFSFDPDDNFVADIVANEATATGYARTDVLSRTSTQDDVGDQADIDAADTAFGALGNGTNNTLLGGVIFFNVGTDATNTLIFFIDTNDLLTNGGTVTLQYAATLATFT